MFSNNYTPVEGSVFGNFTESTIAGYTAVKLTGTDWTVASALGVTTAQHSQHTFTMTTSGTVYGYYVTNDAGTGLLWSEKFTDGPYAIPAGGGTVAITPKITLE